MSCCPQSCAKQLRIFWADFGGMSTILNIPIPGTGNKLIQPTHSYFLTNLAGSIYCGYFGPNGSEEGWKITVSAEVRVFVNDPDVDETLESIHRETFIPLKQINSSCPPYGIVCLGGCPSIFIGGDFYEKCGVTGNPSVHESPPGAGSLNQTFGLRVVIS